eukprot:gene25405-40350_t
MFERETLMGAAGWPRWGEVVEEEIRWDDFGRAAARGPGA